MGEISFGLDPAGPGVVAMMMTPDGLVPITLRCKNNGSVVVEEVASGHLSTQTLMISVGMRGMSEAVDQSNVGANRLTPQELHILKKQQGQWNG